MSSCGYSNVVEPVRKLKKKDGFISTKGNDGKCAMPDNRSPVTVRAKGTKSQYKRREMLKLLDDNSVSIRDTKLQCRKEVSNLNKHKRAILAGEVNPEASKVRRPCSTKNSKSLKGKASKNPLINTSQLKSNAAASVSATLTKKPIKVINRVNCYSNPSLLSDSSVIDDNIEYNLLNSKISEKELLDLNLLPDGLLPHKLTMTPVSTPKKSERPIAGGFYSFDGSRLSPIEEASLIFNSPIADAYSVDSCSYPSVLSDSVNADDDFESYFLSSGLSEQEILDLNLLPDGHLPEKHIITPISTPEKSERVNARGFDSFDGSKYSPIEEAFLVLNSPIEDMFTTPVSVSTEETSMRVSARGLNSFDSSDFSPIEEVFPVFNSPIEDPFISPVSTEVMSENSLTEMFHIPDWNADPTVPLQSSPTQCFDPWSEETGSTSENGASDDKCFWEGIISTDSCSFHSSKAYRMRSSCLTSQWTTDTSGSIISNKRKQHTNDIGEVEWFSNPRFLSDSAVVDDEAEWDLLSSGTSEEELLSLNLLPVGLLPKKEITTSTYTPEKPKIVTAGGIHSFDGSRFSPIEESFLILNDTIANEYACIADKEEETSEVIELKGKLDFCSLSGAEILDGKNQIKGLDGVLKLKTELLKVKTQIKELGWLLESSLRRVDILLPKLARQDVLITY